MTKTKRLFTFSILVFIPEGDNKNVFQGMYYVFMNTCESTPLRNKEVTAIILLQGYH